jgi:two-component system sensor histidine kinase CiaH
MFHKTLMRLTILNTLIFFLILSLFGSALFLYVKFQLYAKIDDSLLQQAKSVQLRQNGFGDKVYYQFPESIDPRVFFITRDVKGTVTSQTQDNNSVDLSKPVSKVPISLPQTMDNSPTTVVMDGRHYRVLAVSNKNIPFKSSFIQLKVSNSPTSLIGSSFITSLEAPTLDSGNLTTVSQSIYSKMEMVTGNSAGELPALKGKIMSGSATFTNEPFNTLVVGSPVATMQFISNIDPELNMLHSLFIIIIAGVAISGLLTLLAGFYLAQRALVPIRESWEKQQQFVADASHELRTPLAVIQANTELLLRHPDHSIEQESGYVSTILKESKRINKLITSLLTFARSDSNQMEIQTKPIDIDSLISECVLQFTPLADLKQIELKVKLECSLEMLADEERIHQLMVILMDNALKYTPERGTISISSNRTAHSVNLIIEDTGVGIPESDLPFIFERFFRGDKIRSRSDGSFGLGLSIAHWIVHRHGGKIRAESQLGRGTRFLLTFPLRK